MISARPAGLPRSAAALVVATASTVVLAAAPAHPLAPTHPQTTAAPARAAAERPVSELLTDLKRLYRKAEKATAAYHRTERELRGQRELTATLERRLSRVRGRLAAGRKEAARIARAQYRTGALGLPRTVRILLTGNPFGALHHEHALRRAAARQQATVRSLASTERHRGAVAEEARDALKRQRELNRRKKRQRDSARDALREVEQILASLTPGQLEALRRYEREHPGQPAVTSAR